MALTREEVLHVARLARVGLSDADVAKFQQQLSSILEHFDVAPAGAVVDGHVHIFPAEVTRARSPIAMNAMPHPPDLSQLLQVETQQRARPSLFVGSRVAAAPNARAD